jgi:hypothetical protein
LGKNNIDHQRRKKKTGYDLYYNQAKTTREIAKIERMSIRDISNILRRKNQNSKRINDLRYLPKPINSFPKRREE